MIKAVIFDIDGVLLDSFKANLKFYQDLLKRFGYKPPTSREYIHAFYLPLNAAIRKLTGSIDETEIKKMWEAGKSRKVPYQTDLLKIPPGLEKVLKDLSQEYKIGIVTSRVRNSVYEAPQLKKLKKYFKTAVAFEDTQNHKPSPEPLLLVTKRLKVKSGECVYV